GDILPVSNKFTARVPLVQLADQSLLDTTLIATEEGQKVFEFIEYVQSDEFWSAQVAHISVDENMEVSILPQVTKQIVEFGPIEDIDEKFKKLKIFYKKILPGKGWNYYETVSLKYKDQIVAKKP
ncbi:MAG: cell division protein FtsQ, partial [bacterium]|nr:cell division protein FtsQ [bacterium]